LLSQSLTKPIKNQKRDVSGHSRQAKTPTKPLNQNGSPIHINKNKNNRLILKNSNLIYNKKKSENINKLPNI